MRVLSRIAIILLLVAMCAGKDVPGFKVTRTYPVPGEGGFDYIVFDASSNRLYVSHESVVNVVDAQTGKHLGKIEGTPRVHGIAIVPALHRGYTTNEGDSTVSVFDTTTFTTIKNIPVSKQPDFIFYDPITNRVMVCHEAGEVVMAIDPEKNEVVGKVELGSEGEAAVVMNKDSAFINLEKANLVVNFDPVHMTVKHRWPIPGCNAPVPLSMDAANARLFIGCRSKVLAVMDATTGKVIAVLPIGGRVDAVVYDPDNKLVFASNGEGMISVIRQKSPNEYESLGSIKTQTTAKTMAFDRKTKRLFLSAVDTVTVDEFGPTAQTKPQPGTFKVLVVERQQQAAAGK